MTDQKKFPKGRPPKSKNVLLKSTMEPIKEQPSNVPIVPEEIKVEPVVEKKEEEVKEKKPRSEQQILATKRLVEANKAKRKITIIDSNPEPKPEPKPESKPEPKPEPKTEPKPEQNLYDKLKQMEEKLAIMEQQKSKKKTKPEPKTEPDPKPVKEPKPKKMQRVESSESEESESESDDDQYVEKYKQKAERRFQAVQAIEQRLQAAKAKPRGKYDHLSLF